MIKTVYKNHEEIINYLIVGILTTIVSLSVKNGLLLTILNPKNSIQLQVAVIISWIVAVIFAYITNKIFVFKSKSKEFIKEITTFISGRVFTLLCDMFIMWFICNFLNLNTSIWVFIASMISQVVVTILNYIISKMFVFKR